MALPVAGSRRHRDSKSSETAVSVYAPALSPLRRIDTYYTTREPLPGEHTCAVTCLGASQSGTFLLSRWPGRGDQGPVLGFGTLNAERGRRWRRRGRRGRGRLRRGTVRRLAGRRRRPARRSCRHRISHRAPTSPQRQGSLLGTYPLVFVNMVPARPFSGRRFVTNVSSVPHVRFPTDPDRALDAVQTPASEPAAGVSASPFPSGCTGFSRHQAAHDALAALPDSPVQLDTARMAGTAARIAASAGRLGSLDTNQKRSALCAGHCRRQQSLESPLPDGVIQETG